MSILIIAEIGQAHDGSLGILHSYIDAAAETGVDAVKCQIHIADAESSPYERFRVNFSYEDETRSDYWRRMEFTPDQWKGIKRHCDEAGVRFICSPFSNAGVDVLEEAGVWKYKIGSGEVTNLLLLEKIARTGKDIILSSGMSSFRELDEAVNFIQPFGVGLSIVQCTTRYPAPPEHTGLNVIGELKARYNLPTGLSDHSGAIYPAIAAAALGAELIEVHVVFDKRMFGPDATSSLTIAELGEMVRGVRFIETAMEREVDKNDDSHYDELKEMFGKSLAVNKGLPAGGVLAFEDLEAKKPAGRGIPARRHREVVGRTLAVDKKRWDFLGEDDLR